MKIALGVSVGLNVLAGGYFLMRQTDAQERQDNSDRDASVQGANSGNQPFIRHDPGNYISVDNKIL